jgi:hypothetical protein
LTVIVPDFLSDVRYFLRRQSDLVPLVGGRVFFRIPDTALFPLQRIYRSGGGIRQAGGDAPIQDILLSVECWGAPPDSPQASSSNGYESIRQIVAATESAIWQLPSGTQINPSGQTLVVSAVVTNAIDSPDPDTGSPRYVLDSRWSVMSNVSV